MEKSVSDNLKVRVHVKGQPVTFEIREGEDVLADLNNAEAREVGLVVADAVKRAKRSDA